MAQLFTPAATTLFRVAIVLMGLGAVSAGVLAYGWARSGSTWNVGKPAAQPIPFRHDLHSGSLGIDCRYCHTAVEQSAFAGIPSTGTCMNCHSQIWTNSPMLEPVRESYRTGRPLRWTRVHNLADLAYFNPGIHIHKGVGCVTCHGRVDQMPLVSQESSLLMEWCLECHRNPEQFLRPRQEVFNMTWTPPTDQLELGRELVRKYNIRTEQLTDCSICHR